MKFLEEDGDTFLQDALARAVRCHDEFAWRKGDALEVVARAMASGMGVIGVEVWSRDESGPLIPQPITYGWARDLQPDETWPDFVKASGTEARQYLEEFAWDADDPNVKLYSDPYFNLEIIEESEVLEAETFLI